jgi:hypothetical protein
MLNAQSARSGIIHRVHAKKQYWPEADAGR